MQKNQTDKFLTEFLSIPTAPLFEDKVAAYIQNFAKQKDIPLTQDIYGNLIIEYQKAPLPPAIGFVAHMDHPGFEIEEQDEHGLRLVSRGGVVVPLEGEKLVLYSNEEKYPTCVKKVSEVDQEKREFYIWVTPPAGFSGNSGFALYDLPEASIDSEKIQGPAIDDLAGCAAMLAVLDRIIEEKPSAHVYFIFTRAEEIGFIGASGLALSQRINPQVPLISLEASKWLPGAEQGKGVIIRLGDKASIFDPLTTGYLIDIAQALYDSDNSFSFQKRVMDGGSCEGSLFCAFGYKSSGVALPLGNYHNRGENNKPSPENIHYQDWINMTRLLYEAAIQTEKMLGKKEYLLTRFMERFQKFRTRCLIKS